MMRLWLADRFTRLAMWLEDWGAEDDEEIFDERSEENIYTTGVGQVIVGVHSIEQCVGRHCVIHNPSQHSMSHLPTNFRHGGMFDIKPPHMERICPHGIGHPDPDDVVYWASRGEDIGVHGCDGCCRPSYEKSENERSEHLLSKRPTEAA